MQWQQTAEQQSGAGIGGLVRPDWYHGVVRGLAVLAGLLLFPLHVGAQRPGDLDTNFNGDGLVTTDFGNHEQGSAAALQPDGKIVAVGYALNISSLNDFALTRYHPNGTLDTTFGDHGQVTTDFGETSAVAQAAALQPDGKIVAAGYTIDASTSVSTFALARYLPDGMLDPSFSGDGRVTTDTGTYSRVSAVVLQPDGKIVAAGSLDLARYHPNGTLDTTFGDHGLVTANFGEIRAVALQPDGKIVAAGQAFNAATEGEEFVLARYLPNGTLDTTFSGDGWVTTDVGGRGAAAAVALQPDGKIVAAGSIVNLTTNHVDFALARYLPDGTLDPNFDGDGRVTTDFGGPSEAAAVALQPDGKIVAVGYFFSVFALARYHPNGMLDTTFGDNGMVTTDFGGEVNRAHSLVIQSHDGRLVVAGWSGDDSSGDFALARYHAITCGDVVVTRIGTNGDDTLLGTNGPDVINAFEGKDILTGLGGNDILCGDLGKDILLGGSGDDLLIGGPGKDSCNGGTGSADQAEACEQMTDIP